MVEFAILAVFIIFLLFGSFAIILGRNTVAQLQAASVHAALVAARTDPGINTATNCPADDVGCHPSNTSDYCPTVTNSAAVDAVAQTLSFSTGSSSLSPTLQSSYNISNSLPLINVVVIVSCQNPAAPGVLFNSNPRVPPPPGAPPPTVTVTIEGDINLNFIPSPSLNGPNPTLPITQSQTAVIQVYRSRSS